MANSPITGNEDLDAYLFDLQLQIGEGTSASSLTADVNTGEVITTDNNQVISYLYRYIHIRYADNYNGDGFSTLPTDKSFYGVLNTDSKFDSENPADYTWKETTGFGTTFLLYYKVSSGRRIEFELAEEQPLGFNYDNTEPIDLDLLQDNTSQLPMITYANKYIKVRYADSINPTEVFTSAWGHSYWGVAEVEDPNAALNPSDYRWYRAKMEDGTFVTFQELSYKLYFWTRGGRAIAYMVTNFPPDVTVWGDLSHNILDINNPYIDLDIRSGLVVTKGSTPSGLSQLPTFTDPITGVVSYQLLQTLPNPLDFDITSISRIATDQYGRVISLGFLDQFFAASESFVLTTNGETLDFPHIVGQAIFFRNGVLLNSTEYTETSTTVTVTDALAGSVIDAYRFRMLDGNTSAEIVPFIVEEYSLYAGQDNIPSALVNNTEMLFLNGVFIEDYGYSINLDGSITLEYPVLFDTQATLYKFAVRNGYSPPFSQSISYIDAQSIFMSTSLDLRGLLTFANGVTLVENTDYVVSGTNGILLSYVPVETNGLLETVSFISHGSGEWNGVPKATDIDYTTSSSIAGPKQPDTLGTIINDLRTQIVNLTTEVNNLKGNT